MTAEAILTHGPRSEGVVRRLGKTALPSMPAPETVFPEITSQAVDGHSAAGTGEIPVSRELPPVPVVNPSC